MRIPFFGEIDKKSETGEDAVSKLENLHRICDTSRRQYEAEWRGNAMMVEGKQWDIPLADQRSNLANRSIPYNVPDTKVKVTDNWLFAMLRQGMSGLRDNLGQQMAVAATTEIEDLLAAELATDFLRFRYDEDDEFTKRFREVMGAAIYGRAMSKIAWDPDRDGYGEFGTLKRAGDIDRTSLSLMQYYVDPWHSAFEDCEFVIEVSIRSVDEIKDIFGVEVESEDVQDASNLLDTVAAGADNIIPKRKGAVILKQMSVRPRHDLPKGRVIYWTSRKRLEALDLPDGLFPYQALDWFPVPGRNYPMSFVGVLKDIQRRYNIMLSQIFELANRQLRGDVVIRGSGIVTAAVDADGRKIITIPHGVEDFKFMQYDLNAQTAQMLMGQLWHDAQQLAGLREPSLGGNPPGVRTSSALMILKEADTAGLGLFKEQFDQAYSKTGRQKIILARNHYKTARMIRTVGATQHIEKVKAFFGAELRNTQDVRTRSVPIFTEAEKRQIIQEAIAGQLYGPYVGPQDKYAKMKALLATGLPGIEDEVTALCAPLSLDELREIATQMDLAQAGMMMEKIQLERMMMKAQMQAGPEAMMAAQQPGGQGPPGAPAPEAAMAGAPA